MNRALFLDRDGVINEDYGYVHKIEDFHFREGIFDVCRAAQKARMKIIVVTNQAGIGRGIYSANQFLSLTRYMISAFACNNVIIHDVYWCPYHPEHGLGHYRADSTMRKPKAGMLIKACNEHNINPVFSIMIGDRISDMVAAAAVGIRECILSTAPDWASISMARIQLP